MVIVKLMGGLGNQMFQYAAGRRLAHARQTRLKLDISFFQKQMTLRLRDTPRTYRLGFYNILEEFASSEEVEHQTGKSGNLIKKYLYKIHQSKKPYHRRSYIKERFYYFDPGLLNAPRNVVLEGYWQTERYFKDIEHLLRDELILKYSVEANSQNISCLINQTESVSIHVRRGDYISDTTTHDYHGVCSVGYYQSAVRELLKSVKQPHFFVFSDDIEWAIQKLRTDYPTYFVTHKGIEKDYEDLHLMSQCKHHIIANSSFSWWGAWLCENPDKIILAPKKWFNDPGIDTRDLLPEDWIQLSHYV